MDKDEIIKGNKLIAEFLGMQYTNIGWFDNESNLNLPNTMDNTFDLLLFNSSWDWLIPCFNKLRILGYKYAIEENSCTIMSFASEYNETIIECETIKACYAGIISFVKSYNKQK